MNKASRMMVALTVVALPLVAHAGLPSMYGAGFFHMTFGALFIGLLDMLVLRRYFGGQKRGCLTSSLCVLLMVCANVLSLFALVALRNLPGSDIIDRGGIEWLKPLFLFVMTVVYFQKMIVELPFVYFALCLLRGDRSWRGVWKASLGLQSISFVLLVLMYSLLGDGSLLTIKVVDVGDMHLPDGIVVKYVMDDGKGIALDVRTGQTAEADADAIYKASLRDYPEEVRYVGGTNELWKVKVISFDSGGFNETISCHNKKTGRSFKMGLQTPIATWFIDDVTMIPGSKVIFRLDNQQIVVADPERNRIAVLALGRNPVVEMPVKGPKGESEIMK